MDIKELFAGILNEKIENINDETGSATTAKWTSLIHLQLVTTIEDVYNIKFSNAEIKNMKSLGICKEILETKGVKF